jgi:hypothetical protein
MLMSPIRREVLNGLFVLVLSTLLSAAIGAFGLKFNLQIWVLIIVAAAMAILGYIVFKFLLSTEEREIEWLKRVGTPARLELNREGDPAALRALGEAVKNLKPGSDCVIMYYVGARGEEAPFVKETAATREKVLLQALELLKAGTIREYKRLVCFDYDVLANNPELKSGILRVGEGPGTITREHGEHCRRLAQTTGCSLYVAPAIPRFIVVTSGRDGRDRRTRLRRSPGRAYAGR